MSFVVCLLDADDGNSGAASTSLCAQLQIAVRKKREQPHQMAFNAQITQCEMRSLARYLIWPNFIKFRLNNKRWHTKWIKSIWIMNSIWIMYLLTWFYIFVFPSHRDFSCIFIDMPGWANEFFHANCIILFCYLAHMREMAKNCARALQYFIVDPPWMKF